MAHSPQLAHRVCNLAESLKLPQTSIVAAALAPPSVSFLPLSSSKPACNPRAPLSPLRPSTHTFSLNHARPTRILSIPSSQSLCPQLERQAPSRLLVGLRSFHVLPLLLLTLPSNTLPLASSEAASPGAGGRAAEGRLEGQAGRRVRRSGVPRRGRWSVDVFSLPERYRA